MTVSLVFFWLLVLSTLTAFAAPQTADTPNDQTSESVALNVNSGVPLQLYLTKRLSKRLGEPVSAKLLEPVFAFDREVIPAGAEVHGTVSRLDSVSKMSRTVAILGGDLTPLHQAQVEFTTVVLPNGRQIALQTVQTVGLNSVVSLRVPKKAKQKKDQKQSANGGVLGTAKSQINAQISSRTQGVVGIVREPDKLDRVEELLLAKLPYHPQWVRKGTRFDAELLEPLQFGNATIQKESLQLLGSQPPPDSVVQARLLTPLSSGTAKQGQNVQAVISQPLFSPDHKLILPAGTRLTGAVTSVHAARWFHRGGQLRFNFEKINLPPEIAQSVSETPLEIKTAASLEGAESDGPTAIKVDEEGGVKAVEPKTRLIAPIIAGLIAAKSMDEAHRDRDDPAGAPPTGNASGKTLGGASGLGLLGAVLAQSSRTFGSVMGFYGMGWSVYSNVVARGGEVEFGNNTAVDIRFGSRAPSDPKVGKLVGRLRESF